MQKDAKSQAETVSAAGSVVAGSTTEAYSTTMPGSEVTIAYSGYGSEISAGADSVWVGVDSETGVC